MVEVQAWILDAWILDAWLRYRHGPWMHGQGTCIESWNPWLRDRCGSWVHILETGMDPGFRIHDAHAADTGILLWIHGQGAGMEPGSMMGGSAGMEPGSMMEGVQAWSLGP